MSDTASQPAPPAVAKSKRAPLALSLSERAAARRIIAAKLAGNLADLLANAKTTVLWMMLSAGAPAILLGMLVPVRESGSMLPQLWLSRVIRRTAIRKWVSVWGALGQAGASVAMALAAWRLTGWAAGLTILTALCLLALMRALSSIAGKDVLARTVPKGARGRITGLATSLAGTLGVAASLTAMFVNHEHTPTWVFALIVGAAGIAFLASAFAYAYVAETPPQTNKEKPIPHAQLKLIWRDPVLRRFVLARTLLLGSALGAPYFVIFGAQDSAQLSTLAAFVLAGGGASALSAWAWGRVADTHGERTMFYGGALAAFVGAIALTLRASLAPGSMPVGVWAALYFAFSIGYAGVRVGRKTYVVDIAGGDLRTTYVATSNTAIAIALLGVGGIGAMLHTVSPMLALLFFVALTAIGAGMSLGLKTPTPTPSS